jgi:hypothetical protein
MSIPDPRNQSKLGIKRAVISLGQAFGIKPVGRRWIEAFSALNGAFERTGWELTSYVATLVFVAAFIVMSASFGIREYRNSGWSFGMELGFVYCLGMSCLLAYLISRASLRYVFRSGTIHAYNTWGRMLWSEDLTGLKDVSFFSGQGGTAMTLFWADRKRRMVLFNSLRRAMDVSLESVERSEAEPPAIKGDTGSWICPHCHEENPENFNECWKCLRMRENSA